MRCQLSRRFTYKNNQRTDGGAMNYIAGDPARWFQMPADWQGPYFSN